MEKRYLTIKVALTNEIVIEKSRFICSIARAHTEAEANAFIQKIKKTHYTATHNCSAYIIGSDAAFQRQSDDGEPSGTAGIPMIEVLRKNNLTDTVCVVTRYFGGIKLGAGGLIRAYSGAVAEIIKKAGIIEKVSMQLIELTFEYSLIGILDSRLSNYHIINKTYDTKVTYDILVNRTDFTNFKTWIIDLTNNRIEIDLKEIKLIEVDYQK